jgi:lipoyl(octanoyl) transferase
MRRVTRERIDGARLGDELWLTDHPPVYTLGFASRPEHLREVGGIPVVTTERGGQVTYHGPGQVVAYLLLDLRARGIGVRELVCRIEAGVIHCLAGYGIRAFRRDGAPGIFVARTGGNGDDGDNDHTRPKQGPGRGPDLHDVAKIASIGLKVSRGFTWHGVALNGDMDLEPFDRIDPCGFAGLRMTDVRREAAPDSQVRFDDLSDRLGAALVESIGG